MGSLFVQFLLFYLDFDAEHTLISIKKGGFIPKEEGKDYISYFSMEDPFEDDYDPGHTLWPDTEELDKFKTVFVLILGNLI